MVGDRFLFFLFLFFISCLITGIIGIYFVPQYLSGSWSNLWKTEKNTPSTPEQPGVSKDYEGVIPFKVSLEYRVPILMYHYVEINPHKEDFLRDSINIPPNIFDSQIATLKNAGYSFITPMQLPALLKEDVLSKSKFVIISFDDGYRDFYTDAYPILKKHNAKAVVYVVPNFINKQNYMYDSQIIEIATDGLVEIGSHTLNHRYLDNIDLAIAKAEIVDSKKIIEDKFLTDVYSFAYPFGAYNDDLIKLIKESGYTNAVSTDQSVMISQDEIYRLPRLRPGYNTGQVLLDYLEASK